MDGNEQKVARMGRGHTRAQAAQGCCGIANRGEGVEKVMICEIISSTTLTIVQP